MNKMCAAVKIMLLQNHQQLAPYGDVKAHKFRAPLTNTVTTKNNIITSLGLLDSFWTPKAKKVFACLMLKKNRGQFLFGEKMPICKQHQLEHEKRLFIAANYEDDDEQGKMIKYSYTSDESLYKNYDLKQ